MAFLVFAGIAAAFLVLAAAMVFAAFMVFVACMVALARVVFAIARVAAAFAAFMVFLEAVMVLNVFLVAVGVILVCAVVFLVAGVVDGGAAAFAALIPFMAIPQPGAQEDGLAPRHQYREGDVAPSGFAVRHRPRTTAEVKWFSAERATIALRGCEDMVRDAVAKSH